MNPIVVGRNIARYRKAKELTQSMLADSLGVSNKAISKWECGRGLPDKSMFPFIQEVLGITREQLFEGAETKTEECLTQKYFRLVTLIAVTGVLFACALSVVFGLRQSGFFGFVPPAVKYTLTLKGAAFGDGGGVATSLTADSGLPAVVTDPQKTLLGWADGDNVFYTSANFRMPADDTVLSAVYAEDLGDIFTPSCLIEEIATGAARNVAHTNVGYIRATRYEFDEGVNVNVGYKILNGNVLRNDTCNNTCPVSAEHANIVFMTFINQGTEDLPIRYEVDFYKIIGQVSVTVPAGGQVRVPLCYGPSPAGFSGELTPFHRLHFGKTLTSRVSLTVYGELYNPDYYEQAQSHILTLTGATYDGDSSVQLLFNARLSAAAKIAHTETDKTFVGWKTSKGKVFGSDEELVAYFKMPLFDVTLTALYLENMTLFTPSCIYKDKSKPDTDKQQGTHNADGSTSYDLSSDVESWLIYNGEDEKHEVAGGCPVSINEERIYALELANGGDTALTLEIGPEYRGIKDPVTVTVPARSAALVAMRVFGVDTPTSFWQINNLSASAGAPDIDLTLIGYYA